MPPKSGVLTLCVCVCACTFEKEIAVFAAYKLCVHVCVSMCAQTVSSSLEHLRFPQKRGSDGIALGYCGDYVRQQNKRHRSRQYS